MNIAPVKTPNLLKRVFPNMVWLIADSDKTIYLTFDDGPTLEITDWTLALLKQFNAKATFFCIGKNVEAYPEIYQRIISEEHAIGNHSHQHIKGWKTSIKNYLNDVKEASKLIDSNLFRPPYGQVTPLQAKAISNEGYKIIMWTILSLDWDATVSKERCAQNVIQNTSSGDIIVFHDSIKASKNMQYALPKVLEYFTKEGYEFKRIPESVQ